jgi:thiamine pyrophosphokinase
MAHGLLKRLVIPALRTGDFQSATSNVTSFLQSESRSAFVVAPLGSLTIE